MIYLGEDPFVKKYQGIVLQLVARYSTGTNDFQDLVSAGILGLLKARRTFKKNRNCKMSTWVFTNARSEIQKAKNSELLIKISPATAIKKKIELVNYANITETRTEQHTPITILCQQEHERERLDLYNDVWRHLNKKFNSKERLIIIDYFCGGMSIHKLDQKYKINSFKIIQAVKMFLHEIYDKSSSSSGFF